MTDIAELGNIKILMDLHVCFDGYSGIPGDTRTTYQLLSSLDDIRLGGHVLDPSTGALSYRMPKRAGQSGDAESTSRYIVALEANRDSEQSAPRGIYRIASLFKSALKYLHYITSYLGNILLSRRRLVPLDSEFCGDYLWRSLFSRSVDSAHRSQVLSTRFLGSRMSWSQMHAVVYAGLPRVKLDTRGWDIYISQTPFPGDVSAGTKLVMRIHDIVPMQYPHTIKNMDMQTKIAWRLIKSHKSQAFFVCNSQAVREKLLDLLPMAEERAFVVPCCVSEEFYRDMEGDISDILSKRSAAIGTDQSATRSPVRGNPGESKFGPRFMLAVGTLEPRKNYKTLLQAWERCGYQVDHDMRLVIVANRGWNHDFLLQQYRHLAEKGDIVILNDVPVNELRFLYSSAETLVVPSYDEGFSFTGVEAMKCGTAVLASGIKVHRSVYGDGARYFDPYSVDSLVDLLISIIKEGPDVSRTVPEDLLMQYSPASVAQKWKEVLTSIAELN